MLKAATEKVSLKNMFQKPTFFCYFFFFKTIIELVLEIFKKIFRRNFVF